MLVLRYTDRPGVIGALGGLLGEAGVNIAAMQVARAAEGGVAVGVLTLDPAAPPRCSTSSSARSAPARPGSWTSPTDTPHARRRARQPGLTWNDHVARPHPRPPRRD